MTKNYNNFKPKMRQAQFSMPLLSWSITFVDKSSLDYQNETEPKLLQYKWSNLSVKSLSDTNSAITGNKPFPIKQ